MQFRGSQEISDIPDLSGLYAWYYKPGYIDKSLIQGTLSSFFEDPARLSTTIRMRYGISLNSESSLTLNFGSQKQTATDVVSDAIHEAGEFFIEFLQSESLQVFARPVYIGIAKNLNKRIYEQHFTTLIQMWDDDSNISRCLDTYPGSTVQFVMDNLNLPHSFPLEARVRQIAPRDLVVNIFPTESFPIDIGGDSDEMQNETSARRALERLLQLLADPVFGRR